MRLRVTHALLFCLVLFSFSCTKYRDVPYFQDLKTDSIAIEKINNISPLVLQNGDLLAVHVNSLNRDADALINFNLERPNGNVAVNLDRPDQNAATGYLIDAQGEITMQYIGKVKAAGYTLAQLTTVLQQRLNEFLKQPLVTVRLQNFRISVLGDVKNPGTFALQNETVTLTEALALAGDLNTTGLRKKVLLVREVNGTRQYYNVDLTSKNIFTSEYYYLKNRDVIYVRPNREKVTASDSSFQKASLLLSALSIIAIFVTRFQ